MKPVYKVFQDLKSQLPVEGNCYNIASLPTIKNHKIGISQSGLPLFFIKCEDSLKTNTLDSSLEFISVQFNRQCQLINEVKKTEFGYFTIISLKDSGEDLQEYFLKIVFILVKNLSERPLMKDLKVEIEKLKNLFNCLSKPPIKTIQGLWAELLIIEHSKNPDYLVHSWHNSASDKFDFNDGKDKIEVKSTTKNRRIHSFSSDQLTPNPNSKLIIASVITTETGLGKSIISLVEGIEKKVNDKKLAFRVNEIVAKTLGKDLGKAFDVFFDYQLAIDTLRFYDSADIPTISKNNIPSSILNLRFDCDLTEVKSVGNLNTLSNLHSSLT